MIHDALQRRRGDYARVKAGLTFCRAPKYPGSCQRWKVTPSSAPTPQRSWAGVTRSNPGARNSLGCAPGYGVHKESPWRAGGAAQRKSGRFPVRWYFRELQACSIRPLGFRVFTAQLKAALPSPPRERRVRTQGVSRSGRVGMLSCGWQNSRFKVHLGNSPREAGRQLHSEVRR